MNIGIETITTTALSLALDAASLRHQVHAANIANAGTEGFIPQRLSFSAHVDQALMRESPEPHGLRITTQLNARMEPAADADGLIPPVKLDAEIAAMSQNTVHYQALVRALNRHLSILAMAVSEGKR